MPTCSNQQSKSLHKTLKKMFLLNVFLWHLHNIIIYIFMYEGCSETNVSYFNMLAHNVGGSWWDGDRGRNFPTFHYILLPCDRWQHRGSLTQCNLMWKYLWSKGMELNSSMQKNWHPLAFIDACWTFMETKQWIWAQWGNGWCVSAVHETRETATWKTTVLISIVWSP